MKRVDSLMHQAIKDRIFPGGVLLVSRDNRIEFFEAYGCADLFSGAPVTKDTIYDLASLTKPLATTLAVMQLIQESRLSLDQPAVSILPRFMDPLMSQVTIRHLVNSAHSVLRQAVIGGPVFETILGLRPARGQSEHQGRDDKGCVR